MLVGGDGVRDEIRGGVFGAANGEVVVGGLGSGGVGKNGVGNGVEGWRDGRGEGLGVTEMLCHDGCRV